MEMGDELALADQGKSIGRLKQSLLVLRNHEAEQTSSSTSLATSSGAHKLPVSTNPDLIPILSCTRCSRTQGI